MHVTPCVDLDLWFNNIIIIVFLKLGFLLMSFGLCVEETTCLSGEQEELLELKRLN